MCILEIPLNKLLYYLQEPVLFHQKNKLQEKIIGQFYSSTPFHLFFFFKVTNSVKISFNWNEDKTTVV